jgi:hypothetical protein
MKKLVMFLTVGLLASCANQYQGDTLVLFTEKEKDVEPYQTRMIVTKEYVRIDDGEGAKSFVLFDRNKKIVYSVNPDEQSVMSVHEKKLAKGAKFEPPFKLTHSVKEMPAMKDAPTINNETARHFQLITNDEVCYNVVAVKGLMPEVVKALTEFHLLMATDSIVTFNNMPADLHNACDITISTFEPTRQLEFGFPIQEWGKDEYSRALVDYKTDYKADAKLFVFPEGYQHYTVQDLRDGKVSFAK